MACALPSIPSGIGIDPTLPRDGTDFITLQVAHSCLVAALPRCELSGDEKRDKPVVSLT
jgi:hypothetical protein